MSYSLTVIYCDDVREELGSKRSLMGVYSDFAFFPEFPAEIRRLCLFMRVSSDASVEVEEVTVCVKRDDEVIFDDDLSPPAELREMLRRIAEHRAAFSRVSTLQRMHPVLVLENLQIPGPCTLSVSVRINGTELEGETLCFGKRSDFETFVSAIGPG